MTLISQYMSVYVVILTFMVNFESMFCMACFAINWWPHHDIHGPNFERQAVEVQAGDCKFAIMLQDSILGYRSACSCFVLKMSFERAVRTCIGMHV